MNAVGPNRQGNVGPVVHDHHGLGSVGRGHNALALGQYGGVAGLLDPHLHCGRSASKGRIGQ